MNTHHNIIIAIDGPAASGKGTLSRKIASALKCAHMDTGALYRAVAFEVLQAGGNPDNKNHAEHAAQILAEKIEAADAPADILGLSDLREDEVGNAASKVAAIQTVRDHLLEIQRHFAANPGAAYEGAVLDGRDIGTVICPDAPVKLYVTADLETRAARRYKELHSMGKPVTKAAVLEDMRARDARDQGREAAPLKPAEDAVTLDTTHLSESEVLAQALEIIREKLSGPT